MTSKRLGKPSRGIGRSTAIFAFWTGISRIAGLAREILAAAIFGTQGSIAAFVIAFQVPNFLRSLVADSALSAAFLPVFTELEEQGRRREAQRLVGALIGVITMGLGAITLVAIVAAPWIMPVLAPGLSPELIDQTVHLAQIMFPIVVLLGLTGLVSAVLQANGEFGATAFAPVLWNLVIIVGPGRRDADRSGRRADHRLRGRDRGGDDGAAPVPAAPRCGGRGRSRSPWASATARCAGCCC